MSEDEIVEPKKPSKTERVTGFFKRLTKRKKKPKKKPQGYEPFDKE